MLARVLSTLEQHHRSRPFLHGKVLTRFPNSRTLNVTETYDYDKGKGACYHTPGSVHGKKQQ